MEMTYRLNALAIIGSFALIAGSAEASTDTFNLTGNVSNFVYSPPVPDGPGETIDDHYLQLSGVNPTTVSPGDAVDITTTLDQVYTIAPSQIYTILSIALTGTGFGNSGAVSNGYLTFYYGGIPVALYSINTATFGEIDTVQFGLPDAPLTFDSFTDDFTVSGIEAPVSINAAYFDYGLVDFSSSGVPEPNSWLLMLMGVGVIGFAVRRRWRTSALFAAPIEQKRARRVGRPVG
jgi:hypothetical protein